MTALPRALRAPGGQPVEGHELTALAQDLRERCAARARASEPRETRRYRLAGRPVAVLSPARALVDRWLWSLAPWADPETSGEPGLTVRLFEAGPGEDPLAHAGGALRALLLQGEMVTAGGLCAHLHAEGGTLSLFDREAREALVLRVGARPLPGWELAAPLRTVLHWWAESLGAQLVHAAGVGSAGRGALLVGAGGSGKSSTALACAAAGLEIAGDDYLWLEGGAPPVAHALYASAKVEAPRLAAWFPSWRPHSGVVGPGEKQVLSLASLAGVRLATRLCVGSILLPRVSHVPRPHLEPVSAATALLALAPSSLFQLPGGRPAHLPILTKLVRTVPAHRLHLSLDPAANAEAIRRHLEEPATHGAR